MFKGFWEWTLNGVKAILQYILRNTIGGCQGPCDQRPHGCGQKPCGCGQQSQCCAQQLKCHGQIMCDKISKRKRENATLMLSLA